MPARRKPAATKALPRPRAGKEKARAIAPDSLDAYIRAIAQYEPLPLAEEQALGRRIREGDAEALKRLVEANLRFVVSESKKYRNLGLSYLDLIHEGTLGLIEAAKRYDPERGVKFISYAVWWVKQAIFHALAEYGRAFRVPQKLAGQVSRVEQARERLAAELERIPTLAELARNLGLPEEKVEVLLRAAEDDLSLNETIGEDGSTERGELLEQGSEPSVELQIIRDNFERQIRDMVGELEGKEREVIRMRFGLDGEEPRTLQEIGETLKLSRERVRQIESRAKERLRRSQRAQGLRGYLN
jgi:RNA polymerase primary sigma factor